jgi:hypothetical protein
MGSWLGVEGGKQEGAAFVPPLFFDWSMGHGTRTSDRMVVECGLKSALHAKAPPFIDLRIIRDNLPATVHDGREATMDTDATATVR